MSYSIEIRGIVQGVGFRPFIYNLATKYSLCGYVTNNNYGVYIVVECEVEQFEEFVLHVKKDAPPLSRIESIKISNSSKNNFNSFIIKETQNKGSLSLQIPSDISTCKDCFQECEDKNNRRYQYPFITCTNCGPRFSIIKNLPYDRVNTSMDKFVMCKECQKEYSDPQNRRYHAQPIGCFDCGPKLSFFDNKNNQHVENIIDKTVEFLTEGKIIAIKGLGGYHLICDATNSKTIKLLREKKQRPSKPFAMMLKDEEMLKEIAYITSKERQLLNSNKRPIVLLKKKKSNNISKFVSPHTKYFGVFFTYTSLHQLVLKKFNTPIVATSANLCGEPLCTTKKEIMKLSHIWDYCLDNDREIVNSCDDSVAFVENEIIFMLREARGYSPTYLPLHKKNTKKALCLGANQKSTVAITIDDKAIISPYIGDLNTLSSIKHFKSNIEILKRIYNFEPEVIVCDMHPNYESTKYAKELKSQNNNLELIEVQHHYAHILATMGINNISSKVLGISFDGTGYGQGGTLWGGEFFTCDLQSYERVGHFKEFRLLGGDKAIKEPRRIALSFLFELYGDDIFKMKNPTIDSFSHVELKTLFIAWKNGLNSPLSSSVGRLFDCVASLVDIIQICSHEGESGLMMESLYDEKITTFYDFFIYDGIIDFSLIVKQILDEKDSSIAISKFFNTLVEIIYEMQQRYRLKVVLGGGVFQNRVLLRLLMKKIPDIVVPKEFIANDSAISYGQAIYYTNLLKVLHV